MCKMFNTYDLLVEQLGEDIAYLLCEKLGGLEIQIPQKAHRVHRVKKMVKEFTPVIKEYPFVKKIIVNNLVKFEEIDKSHIYKLIREEEYGNN